ncbi:hypothetical protein SAMN04487906_2961 [Zhouia amylolytica]|uniref:Uncharacterized protein n=1 Tax=Zhouia amylolytica TaxID=376730 RepID=A0A1I6VBP1_9FLAO|nr:hypothetical protein [Zhouia amylolytica]MCQ0110434.1 hypothetical protein [Zhouia amylolytica]SFT11087.1 hypothetical protein SAMN04487906_2961 [Zhouia amylolytica]
MQEQKPKSIKTIGLLVAIFSGFIIFSNGMGALAWSVLGIGNDLNKSEIQTDPISFLFSHYLEMCLIMLLIGIAYLIGGIFIRKYQLWANKMVSGLSALIFLIIWGLMIAITISIGQQDGMGVFSYGAILNALFWSTPIALLIWFLNKKKIKKHFV